MTTAREYAINVLREAGVQFDDDVGNGLLIHFLAEYHNTSFYGKPKKNSAREILENYRSHGVTALETRPVSENTRNVYVIEMDASVLKDKRFLNKNPSYTTGKACLYVGSTCRAPEERFQQHKKGYKACRYPKKFGITLRPDLYDHYNPMEYQEANDREESLAKELRAQGYAVWQN